MKLIKFVILITLLTTASLSQNPHNWHYCGPLESPVNITALYLYGDSSIIAAAYRMPVLYISHNNGTTWDTLTNKLPGNQQGVKHLEMVNGVLYACYLDDNSGTGIWKSLDTGKTWEGTHYPAATAHGFTWFGDYIFASNSPVHRSADSGRTWESFALPTNLPCMCLIHYGDTLYAGTYSGIFWSLDTGKTWVELIPGETTKYFTIDFLGEVLIAGTEVDVALSYNYGLNWNSVLFGDYECFIYNDSLVFARAGVHYKISCDTGKTWQDFKQYDSTGKQMYFDRIWTNKNSYFINNGWGVFKQNKLDSTKSKKGNNKWILNKNISITGTNKLNYLNIFTKTKLTSINIFSLSGRKINGKLIFKDRYHYLFEYDSIITGIYVINVFTENRNIPIKLFLKR